MVTKREALQAEDAAWNELAEILESLTPEQAQEPGYFSEGWSVKDLMGHVACWCAEAAQMLEQIRNGTYERRRVDVDALNREFYECNRDLPLSAVRAELFSARTRMVTEWNALPELTREAEGWFRESGVAHYTEHLDRLREWAGELSARPRP